MPDEDRNQNPLELPWEAGDEEDAPDPKEPKVEDKPAPPKLKVPKFDSTKLKQDYNRATLKIRVETLEKEITEAIQQGTSMHPADVAGLVEELASTAYAHDRADAGAEWQGVATEEFPLAIQEHTLAWEKAGVDLSDVKDKYGEESLTYAKAVEDHARLGVQKKAMDAELKRRNDEVGLKQYREQSALALAENMYRREMHEALAQAEKDGMSTWDMDRLRYEANIDFRAVPDRDKRVTAALETVHEESRKRNEEKYREAIMSKFQVDGIIKQYVGQTQETVMRLKDLNDEKIEAKRRADELLAAHEAEKRDSEFQRMLDLAATGQNYVPPVVM